MSDWPIPWLEPNVTIHPWSLEALGKAGRSGGGTAGENAGSAVWPAANDAIFIPFRLGQPVVFKYMFWLNGAAVSGNVDAGIYDEAGTLLVSTGSTAQAGTSVVQSVDITDTLIGPGLFYLALALDNTTGAIMRGLAGAGLTRTISLGLAKMATAFPLPATATFATVTADYIPVVVATTRTVI